MSKQDGEDPRLGGDRTGWGVLLAVISVLPAYFAAGIVVVVYSFILRRIVQGHWIPYLEEISLQWFPELLRGLITGALVVIAVRRLIPTANLRVVRYTTFAFWGGIGLFLASFSVASHGLSFELIGIFAMLAGLAAGLWGSKHL